METRLDTAFNWLVAVLSIISGTLTSFPEVIPFYLGGGFSTVFMIRLLVFPILILVILWLWSSLAGEGEHEVIMKSVSWIFASIILAADVVIFLTGTVPPINEAFVQGRFGIFQTVLPLELIVPIPFCYFVIRPRLREMHKESKFLSSLLRQTLIYIVAVILYILSIGFLDLWPTL
ncbi:MAG: hypothetical protein OEY88_10970 [Candidatus Bathyarchaeota archaeon]|nr:hypothetical protein [Candidatus Bathyarchaeota archaeon]